MPARSAAAHLASTHLASTHAGSAVPVSVALPAVPAARPVRFDLSWPILILFVALLCVMILLPMSWLVYYSFVDRSGAFTLSNFTELVTNPIFLDPLITTVIIATSSSIICCLVAAPIGWLVAPPPGSR